VSVTTTVPDASRPSAHGQLAELYLTLAERKPGRHEAIVRAQAAVEAARRLQQTVETGQRMRAAARERRWRDRHAAVHTLVESHLDLARSLATRYAGRGQPLEDLRQIAHLGLLKAARRFDAGRGVQFSTYAQAVITGELKRYFRDHAWQLHVPRPVQELYLRVRATVEDLSHSLGRSPTPAELAEVLEVDVDDVVEALDVSAALHPDSLDAALAPDGEGIAWEPSTDDHGFDLVDDRSWLAPALASLPERERRIVHLRFVEDLTQSQIGERVGISQMHVSRLLARALARLRESAVA
jgi:RNA polymerase sigma-B factor